MMPYVARLSIFGCQTDDNLQPQLMVGMTTGRFTFYIGLYFSMCSTSSVFAYACSIGHNEKESVRLKGGDEICMD